VSSKPCLEEEALGAAVLMARKGWFEQMMVPGLTTERILEVRADMTTVTGRFRPADGRSKLA
jgi:hypothetical protein